MRDQFYRSFLIPTLIYGNYQLPLIQNKIKIMDSLKKSRHRQFEKKVEQEEQVGRFRRFRTTAESRHIINGVPSKYIQNDQTRQNVEKAKFQIFQYSPLRKQIIKFSIRSRVSIKLYINFFHIKNHKMGKLLYLILIKKLKGHRLNFIDNYRFTYQPFWKNYMDIFEMKSSNNQYLKTKDIPVEGDLDYGFILNNIQNQNEFIQLSLAKI
ncbi:unnamed protein product [Paramecium octaurelia]|uniref:Uncharacterized protein n=1 Tax=Paramecium octaurelia TaxID=43137 RepID=A0A8S1YSR9_PAROT|nr:unnamed protein product [Paramecium octaurelia]